MGSTVSTLYYVGISHAIHLAFAYWWMVCFSSRTVNVSVQSSGI